MNDIFLSASVPRIGQGNYHETASPFLIQCAVRELIIAVVRTHRIVWGGHPAITPMIWSICDDLKVEYSNSVVLYQSRFFDDSFPDENKHFGNVVYVDEVPGNRSASLQLMREKMLLGHTFESAVFIGGMDGVEEEHLIFRKVHPSAKVLFVASPGGAAMDLAKRSGFDDQQLNDVDFARIFHAEFTSPLAP